MNETPNEPLGPDEDRRRQQDDPAPGDPLGGQSPPPGGDDDDEDDEGVDEYREPNRRRILSGRRLVATGLAVVALLGGGAAFALSGGDNAADDPTSSSDSNGSSQEDALFEFSQCMRDNGIEDFPDPQADGGISIGGSGIEDQMGTEEFRAAQEECQPILDDAAAESGQRLTPEELAERRDQMLALAQCVRERGYENFPVPEVDEYGRVKGLGARGVDQSVIEECARESGPGGPEGDAGGSSTDGRGSE